MQASLYMLSGLCLVLLATLIFQIKPAPIRHTGALAVKYNNKIIKISPAELHKLVNQYQEKFAKLRRHSNSANPRIVKVTAGIRRFIQANTDEENTYNFPLVVDFLSDNLDIDDPEPPYNMLMFELARLEKIIYYTPTNLMLDIDAINNLLMELTADILKQDTSYIGENRSSNNASSNNTLLNNKLPNGAGFTLNAPLKFDESVELDHRMYKPSGAIRPTQGEQSQEYEGF
jgi:hypothetical protein